MATTMKHLEQRLNVLAEQNAELRAEVDRLRREREPVAPSSAPPQPRVLPGQGTAPIDVNGNRIAADINAVDPAACTVGASAGFGPRPKMEADGSWVEATGLRRNPDGELATAAPRYSTGIGPVRSRAHEAAVAAADAAFPVVPMTLDKD